MAKRYLTVIYEVESDEGRKILARNDWTAAGWSHAFDERDELIDKLKSLEKTPEEPTL